MASGQKWKPKEEENFLKEEGLEAEKTLQYHQLLKEKKDKLI